MKIFNRKCCEFALRYLGSDGQKGYVPPKLGTSYITRAVCHPVFTVTLYSLDPVVRHVEVVEGDGRGGDLLEQVVRQEDAPDAHQAPEGAPLHRLDPVVR